MSRFIESICCIDGVAMNLDWHQRRVDHVFCKHFHTDSFRLAEIITDVPPKGTYKCRLVYHDSPQSLEFLSYTPRSVKSLKVVHSNNVNYAYKYEDRNQINVLLDRRQECEEILIVKNGLITDSSYANVALYNGREWHTPKYPLLEGTKRAQYIQNTLLVPKNIEITSLYRYQKVSLINAMLNLDDVSIGIDEIYE